jgi:hypothetical protein
MGTLAELYPEDPESLNFTVSKNEISSNAKVAIAKALAIDFIKKVNSCDEHIGKFIKTDQSKNTHLEYNTDFIKKKNSEITSAYIDLSENEHLTKEKKKELKAKFETHQERYLDFIADVTLYAGGRKAKKSHKKRKYYKSKKRGKSRKNKTKR